MTPLKVQTRNKTSHLLCQSLNKHAAYLPPEGNAPFNSGSAYWVINSCYITVLFRLCVGKHSPSGMSIAVTTTPKVLVTASPTFLARFPPSSSSSSASSSSGESKYQCYKKALNKPDTSQLTDRKHSTGLDFCIPVNVALCSKQTSQTLTGASPQPLSGTGAALEEQPSQKPSPQARQWCLVSLSWKTAWHLWHPLYKRKNNSRSCYWPKAWGKKTQSEPFQVLSCDLQTQIV